MTVTSSASAADNNADDNMTSLDDTAPSQTTKPINTDVTDTDLAAAAAAVADDREDDVVARNLQKRQSVVTLTSLCDII